MVAFKNNSGRAITKMSNKTLAEELQKLIRKNKYKNKKIYKKLKDNKIYSSFIDNIWSADFTNMQLMSKFVDITSNNKVGTTITNTFQKILNESKRKLKNFRP